MRNKESSSHRPVKSSPRPVRRAVRAGIIDPEVRRAASETRGWVRGAGGRVPAADADGSEVINCRLIDGVISAVIRLVLF